MVLECKQCPKIYQNFISKALTFVIDDLACWNIFFDYFMFKMDQREKGKGWIYVVHLNLDFAVLKVKDIMIED